MQRNAHWLRQHLFGDAPHAHALLAFTGSLESPSKPVRMAIYYFTYSTWTGKPGLHVRRPSSCSQQFIYGSSSLWQLEDFLDETCRGEGIRKAFIAELARVGQEKVGLLRWYSQRQLKPQKGCTRIDCTVLKVNRMSGTPSCGTELTFPRWN